MRIPSSIPSRMARAAPRVIVVLLLSSASVFLSARTTGAASTAFRLFGFLLIATAMGSRDWWRYVKHGKPAPWRVEHGGATALFVTDPGRDRFRVIAHLREHGGLDFGEAVKRADDPARPVWDDLTDASADRICAVLVEAGATASVKPRPSPSWARDVTDR